LDVPPQQESEAHRHPNLLALVLRGNQGRRKIFLTIGRRILPLSGCLN
jgi:hypothetical protein